MLITEFVQRLIREGECQPVLATALPLPAIVDAEGRFLQRSNLVPLQDALRVMAATARRLGEAIRTAPAELGIALDKEAFERVVATLVRVDLEQRDLFTKPLAQRVEADHKAVEQSVRHAAKIATAASSGLGMGRFLDLLDRSGNSDLTAHVLVQCGPEHPGLVGPKGPLPRIPEAMPPTLSAEKEVALTVRIWSVSERDGIARVEVRATCDDYSERVLRHRTADVTLKFDPDSDQRQDLLAAHYLRREILVFAAAECAVHHSYARRTTLTLHRLGEKRKVLNRLHELASQIDLDLDDETLDQP